MEEVRADLQNQVDELEEENDHVKRQHLMANEVKNKLRQETSQLTAENMVRSGAPRVNMLTVKLVVVSINDAKYQH